MPTYVMSDLAFLSYKRNKKRKEKAYLLRDVMLFLLSFLFLLFDERKAEAF